MLVLQNIAGMLTHLMFFLFMSDDIPGLQIEMKDWLCHALGDSFLQTEGRGKRRIDELMVVSPSSSSMSDSNCSMSLEVKQSVVIFLLFILPLQADKIKEVKLKLWRASLPSFFCASVILCDCSSYYWLLRNCHLVKHSGGLQQFSDKKIILWGKKSHKREMKEVVKLTLKKATKKSTRVKQWNSHTCYCPLEISVMMK